MRRTREFFATGERSRSCDAPSQTVPATPRRVGSLRPLRTLFGKTVAAFFPPVGAMRRGVAGTACDGASQPRLRRAPLNPQPSTLNTP